MAEISNNRKTKTVTEEIAYIVQITDKQLKFISRLQIIAQEADNEIRHKAWM